MVSEREESRKKVTPGQLVHSMQDVVDPDQFMCKYLVL